MVLRPVHVMQGAVSRSQTGWEADDIHNREDDFAGESDRSAADSPPRQHGRRGANDLETESFDEDDSPPRRIAPAASGSIRRSNNQEEEDREASRSKATEDGEESVVEEDFEADGSEGSDDEFEFNDDDAYIPSAGEARAQARNAFASPNKPLVSARSEADESGSQHAESEGEAEEEDEYADDGFDDADEEDADHGRGDKGPAVMPPAQRSLFAPATQPPQQQQQQALRRQADDEESVEESIPEEEDEADDMSVGQVRSVDACGVRSSVSLSLAVNYPHCMPRRTPTRTAATWTSSTARTGPEQREASPRARRKARCLVAGRLDLCPRWADSRGAGGRASAPCRTVSKRRKRRNSSRGASPGAAIISPIACGR